MKIFAQVLFILLILIVLCDGNTRPKRTLGTLLRYFGYRIIPIDDVEFVTESIPESTRNPKALRINTQRPSIKVNVEETTPMPTTTTMRSTSTQSIPKFNPLLPDIINSLFQINLTTMRSPMNVRNSMKKTTLKPNKVKGTEFLIRPMDVPNMMSQKLANSMMQSTPGMPEMSDMMQPPILSMGSSGMMMSSQVSDMMQPPAMSMSSQVSDMMQPPAMSMSSQQIPDIMQPPAMPMNIQGMQMNQQRMNMEMSMQGMNSGSMGNQQMGMQMTSQGMESMESTSALPMNATDSNDNPSSQSINQPSNHNQNTETQSLPGFSQQFGSFEMVKSRELPFQQFPGQFIVGNSIATSDYIKSYQHLPFQTQFHTQFSSPHASHFTVARSGKGYDNYNHHVTYYH